VSPAAAALAALIAAIVISCTSRVNVGLIAVGLAWALGLYTGRTADVVLAGFPASLFVTLAGVTLLFSLAETNGTIELLANRLVHAARGSARVVPILIFVIAGIISMLGPGAIASVALVAPLAMAIGGRTGLPPFLTALMVANGANAGNLSQLSAVGVIANARMAAAGLGAHEWKVFAANFLAHVLVSAVAFVLLVPRGASRATVRPVDPAVRLTSGQWLTLSIVLLWVASVVLLKAPIGLAAFAAAAAIVLLRAAEESPAIKRMPWSAILMVSGVTMLVALVEKAGGMDLFTALLARLATPGTVNGMIAFVTGAISIYSSTSGVVLPTFLPLAPRLVEQVGGGNPLAVALSINVGSSLVDVSPLSTLGALCVAAVADPDRARDLFRRLMLWGLAMAVVGALLCQLFASLFAAL
jgi:di/tricarboxylate transporter